MPPERERDAVLPRVDQVLLGRDHAPLAVALLERAGVGRPRVRTVLAETGRGDGGETPGDADWRRLALARGMLLPRPGHGAAEVLHRERLAAPGRLVLCAGPLPGCGAFGMLALGADALEAAAVLAGGGQTLRTPRVLAVELSGLLPRGVGGADLALALLARLRGSGTAADVVEFGGAGAGTLPMAERISAAWLLAQAGLASLFPSDELTRAALAALGREQDWRRTGAAAEGGGAAAESGGGAWPVALDALDARGAPAAEAAGVIHSDLQKGFIRAEVVPYEVLSALGSMAAAREAGKLQLEGKEYIVQDGNIMHVRFNV